MATLGSLIVELRTNSARFQQGLDQANAKLNNINRTASVVRNSLGGLFAGVSAGFLGGAIINEIRGFEKEMSVVGAVSGANAAQMEQLTKKARELGANTGFSASEAAQGMVALSQAGFSTDQTLAAIGDTLNLAAAGGLDLGKAADIATNIMSQFGLEASEAGRVADTLAATASSSNTNVAQMGDAMSYAGVVASALGISVEDTAAALAVLADSGLKSERGGTAFRTFMSRLIDPSNEASAVLQRLGIDVSKISDLGTFFGQLAASGMTAADAVKIFGIEGQGAALAFANKLPVFERVSEVLQNKTGAAAKQASDRLNNLDGDLKALSSTISELMLQTGDAGLAGTLRTATQALTSLLRVAAGAQFMEKFRADFFGLATSVELLSFALGARLVAALTASTQATLAKIMATHAESLAMAENAARTAAATGAKLAYHNMLLAEARATVAAAAGMQRLTLTQTLLIPAQQRAAAASAAHTVALNAQAAAAARALLASRAAGMALAFFGGPIGLAITVVAAAVYLLAVRTSEGANAANLAKHANLELQQVLGDSSASQIAIENAKKTAEANLKSAEAALTAAKAEQQKFIAQSGGPAAASLKLGSGGISFSAQTREIEQLEQNVDSLRSTIGEADAKLASLSSTDPLVALGLSTGTGAGTGTGTGSGGGSGKPRTSFSEVIASEANAVARLQAQLDGTLEAYERKTALAEASSKLGRALTESETDKVLTLLETQKKLNAELEWQNGLEAEYARVLEALKTPQDEYEETLKRLIALREGKHLSQEQFNAALAMANEKNLQGIEEKTSQMTEFALQAARNMETAMSGFFFDVMQGKFDGLGMSFKQTIDRMVSDLLASQVMGFLMGDFGKDGKTQMGGFLGNTAMPFLMNLFGSFFGGARAYGGPVSPNSAYLVGERGPEMFVPNASGRIVPNGQMGGGVVVNMTVNTPDTAGFRRSQSQIASELAASISRGQRNL